VPDFQNKYDQAFKNIINFLDDRKIDYLIIGGIAVSIYYQARATIDIDLILSLDKTQAMNLLKLLKDNKFRFDNKSAESDIKNKGAFRILRNGVQIDLILRSLSFEKDAFKRKKEIKLFDVEFFIPSLEDLILYKLFAARERDIFDLKNIIKGNLNNIDFRYIIGWTQKVCDKTENLTYWNILSDIFKRYTEVIYMEFVTARDFKMKANKYINDKEDIVITKYGKPVAILSPIDQDTVEDIFFRMKSIFREASVSKNDALRALEEARKEIYD